MAQPAEDHARIDKGEPAPIFPPKNIYLFSDGTGNSSAKLQKTNVWRLYEALDLGTTRASPDPSGADAVDVADGKADAPSPTVQIAYYDNGVGTSSIPALAALGGIFGFGLARNVRGMYEFLCRNYRNDDRIFAFGFSRGAFTNCLLVGLIACMGVVQADNESALDRLVHDAWRKFRSDFKPYVFTWPTRFLRRLGRGRINLQRRLTSQPGFAVELAETEKSRPRPGIEFVGVWDTVAAYGGPFIELTRGIDMMVWPLSMNDFRLSPMVRCALHAMAIDLADAFSCAGDGKPDCVGQWRRTGNDRSLCGDLSRWQSGLQTGRTVVDQVNSQPEDQSGQSDWQMVCRSVSGRFVAARDDPRIWGCLDLAIRDVYALRK